MKVKMFYQMFYQNTKYLIKFLFRLFIKTHLEIGFVANLFEKYFLILRKVLER